MKKKVLIFIFVYIFFMLVGKVKGYGLNLELSLENRNGTDYYVFYTYVGASPHSKEVFRSNPQNIPGQDYIKPEKLPGEKDYTGTWNSYDITGITFHSKTGPKGNESFDFKTTINDGNYNADEYKDNKISIYYDTGTVSKYSKGNTKKGYILYQDWFGMYGGILGFKSYESFIGENLQLTYSENVEQNDGNFYTEYTLDKDSKGNYNIVKYKYLIKASYLNQLKKDVNYRSLDADGDDKVYTFHVSMQITALYGNGNPTKIYTAEQFYYYMYKIASENGRYWGPWSRGADYSGNPVAGTSAANDFDNYLKLYEFNGYGSSVSVAHMIKGTRDKYLSGTETVKKETKDLTPEVNYDNSNPFHKYNFDFIADKTSTMIHVSNTSENGIISHNGVNYKCVGYNIDWGDGKTEEYSESNTRDILNTTLYFGKSMFLGAKIIFLYEPESELSRNIYIAYRDITNNKWLGIAPNDLNSKNNKITNEYSKYKYTDSSGNEVLLYDWIEYYRTSQQITAYAINDKNKLKLENNKEYKYAGFKVYKATNNRNAVYNSITTEYKSGNGTEYTVDDNNSSFLIVFNYKVGNSSEYYLRVQHTNKEGISLKKLMGDEDFNKNFVQETVSNIKKENYKEYGYYEYNLSSSNANIKLNKLIYETTNAKYIYINSYSIRYLSNFPSIGNSKSEKYSDSNKNGQVSINITDNTKKPGAIVTYFYDQFPKRTVNVYRKYIDDKNNEIALISPTGKYTVNNFETYKENQNFLRGIFYYGEKSTMPSVANNLKYITANEKDIYEYNGNVKITYYNGSNDKSPKSNNYTKKGLGTSISISSINSKNKKQIDIVFYYTKKPDPEWITVCPKLNFKTVADYLKNAEGKENVATNTCKEKDKTYECTDNDTTTQELVVPIGEDIKPIVNVPKVILIDSGKYSYDNTRGGIWQEVSVKNGKYNLRVVGYKALVLTEVKIKQNDGSNFVSLLSKDKVVYTNPNINNNSILGTKLYENEEKLLASDLGENIGKALSKKFEYSGSNKAEYEKHIYKYATSLTDINNDISKEIEGSNITIDTNAYNGVKSAYATVKYKAVNIGITDFSYYSNISPYLKEGSSSSVLGGDNSNNESGDYERTTKDSVKKKEYSSNSSYVNVYAPLSLSIDVKGINTVDHTTGKDNSTLIQNNAKLKVTAMINPLTSYTEMSIQHIKDKYLEAYYYKFGFKVDYNGKTYESGSWIRGGESIEVLVNDSRLDNDNNTTTSVVSDYMNEIVCMAVTKNIPNYVTEDLTEIYNSYSSSNELIVPTDCTDNNTNNKWSERLKSNNKVKQDAYYAVKATKKIASIGRIYDFRITDCTDVDFKSVFRDSSKSGVNSLSGIVYFSGIKELEIFNSSTSNVLTNRKSPYTIPLGPYKHTNSNYVDAPKMGYRISFDVKTTGKYVTTSKAANELNSKYKKYVKITPSYYYIKKDGTGYNENITLYYMNSSNKYVKFIDSGFKISYKPNDGYRNVTNLGITNITDMFTDKYVTLDVSSHDGFNLNIDSMCTNYSGYVQSWYGEFKLPNTTIAVADGGSVTKPLTDGYIGVKFDIKCIYIYDTQTTEVSYNTPNKNAVNDKKEPLPNTTQWDYEGYLGFKNAGKNVTGNDGLYLQFLKGKLMISSQPVYEQIRGTVVFFDLDNRASNDFE